ncbi:unnamed protein product [Urochloa decumbens]|uniref:F-box domain-containing protein n=1 Tax=Urochloa decumbens TaxID=240449 RepID=A0ABC9GZF6_9POAL
MAPPRPPPELVDDAVAEILLRLPPDEPRHLVRASLVCKRWRRVVADPAFPRRYRSFHRSPPLLGLLRNTYDDDDSISVFLPTTSFRPRGGGHGFPGGIAVDCRHGRALLLDYTKMIWEGRVGILDHCHSGCATKAYVYSTQTGAWSAPASIQLAPGDIIRQMRSQLVSEALYFFRARGILRYDLVGHRLSAIDLPAWYDIHMMLMEAEDGGLGFAGLKGSSLHLWCREERPDGFDRWALSRVIELATLTTSEPFYHPLRHPLLMGYAEGTSIIFVSTGIGNYMFDLKSMQIKNISEGRTLEDVLPYMSFYIPDMMKAMLMSPSVYVYVFPVRVRDKAKGDRTHRPSRVQCKSNRTQIQVPCHSETCTVAWPKPIVSLPASHPASDMASMLLPELVEEILLHIPPDEPAHLVRAALVCKPWCRIISDGGFLRRYRRFHQSPPLLGYIHNAYHHIGKSEIARLVPTSLPSPVIASSPHCYSWWALDCRHGRVLIQMPTDTLVVWDPIAGSQQQLSQPPYLYLECMGAVLCATDGCDHLDCHGDPFVIVFVGTQYVGDDMLTWTSMYSSKTGVWSASKTSISTNFLTWTKPS